MSRKEMAFSVSLIKYEGSSFLIIRQKMQLLIFLSSLDGKRRERARR